MWISSTYLQVDDVTADFIISQLLFLDAEDPKKDIRLFINSPGGSVTAGMSTWDQHIAPPVVAEIGSYISVAAQMRILGACSFSFWLVGGVQKVKKSFLCLFDSLGCKGFMHMMVRCRIKEVTNCADRLDVLLQ